MAGAIQIFIFVFCRLSMDFGDVYDDDADMQEEMWDDGCDNRSDYFQDVPTPPEPRRQFKMPWQAVLSVQVLLGGKVQASTRPWPKDLIDCLGWDHTTDRRTPCPHCKFYLHPSELAEEISYHRKTFIADNQRRAAQRQLAEQTTPAGQPGLQRSKKGKGRAAKPAQPKPESKPGADNLQHKKSRRPRKTKTKRTLSEETETSTPTTKQSDSQDPAGSHGSSKNKNDPSSRPLQSGTMESAPEDTATSTTTTAETSTHPSPLVSLVHPRLVQSVVSVCL